MFICPGISSGDTTIDYNRHSKFLKYCVLIILSGVVLLFLGEGWTPLIACVLSVIVLAAWVGRMRRGRRL